MFDNLQENYLTLGSAKKATVFDNLSHSKRSLWDVNATAQFLGVSPRTIRDWVYRRVIPFRKAGKNVRFDPEEIERWTLRHKEK